MSCGHIVSNTHTGPCPKCGDRIGRIVSAKAAAGVAIHLERTAPIALDAFRAKPPEKKSGWHLPAIAAAAVLCIGSPLLGATSSGWSGVEMGMALNIWSSSVGYYALRLNSVYG